MQTCENCEVNNLTLDPIERQWELVRDTCSAAVAQNISFKLSQSLENALSGKSIRLKGASYASCAQNILCDLTAGAVNFR